MCREREKAEKEYQIKLAEAQKEKEKEEREHQLKMEVEKQKPMEAQKYEREYQERMAKLELERIHLMREKEAEHAKFTAEQAKIVAEQQVEIARIEAETKQRTLELEVEKARITQEKKDKDNTDKEGKPRSFAKVPRMPFFDEEKDFMDSYLNRFERFAESQNWNRNDWATYISALLKGRALDVYARLPPDQATNYDSLKEALLKRYRLSAEGFKSRFRTSKPEAGETPLQFLTRLENYLQRWIELSKIDQDFDGLKSLIIQEQYLNICPKDLALFLRERTPTSITEVGTLAERYLEAHATKPLSGIDPKPMSIRGLQSEQRRCHICRSLSHLKNNCPRRIQHPSMSTPSNSSQSKPVPNCFICGERGHFAKNCYSSTKLAAVETTESQDSNEEPEVHETAAFRPAQSSSSGTMFRQPRLTNQVTCRKHHKTDCSECLDLPPSHTCNALIAVCQECGQRQPIIADACHNKVVTHRMPTAQGTLGSTPVTVLRDTGCSTVVVRRSLISETDLTGKEELCVLIDGTVRRTPVAEINIDTPFLQGKVTAVCMRNPLYDLIIGNVQGATEPTRVPELQATITRSQSRQTNTNQRQLTVPQEIQSEVTPEELSNLQHQDQTLQKAWDISTVPASTNTEPTFTTYRGLLYRIRRTVHGEPVKQLALPVP
ncbi:MAG: hypothetical protein ACWGNP_01865, partial [Candidatus Bathyarchaeia archaeon]